MKILVFFCLVITNSATWLVVELVHNLRRHFQYKRFLKENISNFKLIYTATIGNKRPFSHAGIHLKWLKRFLRKKDSIERKVAFLQEASVFNLQKFLQVTTSERKIFRKRGLAYGFMSTIGCQIIKVYITRIIIKYLVILSEAKAMNL